MTLRLRRATPADALTIAAFNLGLARESESKELDAEVLRRGVEAVLNDPGKGFYTLAESEGVVVGQTMITMEWSDWRNGWFWWIQSVYVRAEARSRGVFRAIFEHLRNEAIREPDVIGLRLYVEHGNTKAQAIYRKLGMVEAGYGVFEMYPLGDAVTSLRSERR